MTILQSDAAGNSANAISALIDGQFRDDAREAKELAFLPKILEGCDRFIDVGANIGQYMFYANRSLSRAEILGIEANPHLLPVIRESCRRAQQDIERYNNFVVECCAITNDSNLVDFYVSPSPDVSSIFSDGTSKLKISVQARSLDSFYRPSRKTVIKMDIEGAEYRAIKSAERFLSSNHTEFFLELHQWGDVEIKKYPLNVCNLFFVRGYACRRINYHYYFFRESLAQRVVRYIAILPHLILLWLPYRYPRIFGPTIKRFHMLLAGIRRRYWP